MIVVLTVFIRNSNSVMFDAHACNATMREKYSTVKLVISKHINQSRIRCQMIKAEATNSRPMPRVDAKANTEARCIEI